MTENTTQQSAKDIVVPQGETAVSQEVADTRAPRQERSPVSRSGSGAKRERGGPGRSSSGPRKGGGSSRGGGRGGAKTERARPEFDSKMIQIRRVTRVVSGGRRFSFSVAVVAGNRKGSVGVGVGKASDTSAAIEKALKDAKKNAIKVPLSNEMMIPHGVEAKYTSSRVMIMPAPGRGMVAGSSVRNVLELSGIKNVNAKILSGSKNKLNNARAAIKALSKIKTKKTVVSMPK